MTLNVPRSRDIYNPCCLWNSDFELLSSYVFLFWKVFISEISKYFCGICCNSFFTYCFFTCGWFDNYYTQRKSIVFHSAFLIIIFLTNFNLNWTFQTYSEDDPIIRETSVFLFHFWIYDILTSTICWLTLAFYLPIIF